MDLDLEFSNFVAEVEQALDKKEMDRWAEQYRLLAEFAIAVAAGHDRQRVAQLRANIARLSRRIERRSHLPASVPASLRSMERLLGTALASIDSQRVAEHIDREVVTLPARVLAALEAAVEPLRPLQLVDELQSDPTQLSRALRTLMDAGQIHIVPAPLGDDRRGRWYEPIRSSHRVVQVASIAEMGPSLGQSEVAAALTSDGVILWAASETAGETGRDLAASLGAELAR